MQIKRLSNFGREAGIHDLHKRFLYFILFYLRNRKHAPCFYLVIETRVEVWENENNSSSPKLSRVRGFHSSIKTPLREKGKALVNFDHQNVSSLCSRHHYVNSW